jgi:hypothetical protein
MLGATSFGTAYDQYSNSEKYLDCFGDIQIDCYISIILDQKQKYLSRFEVLNSMLHAPRSRVNAVLEKLKRVQIDPNDPAYQTLSRQLNQVINTLEMFPKH